MESKKWMVILGYCIVGFFALSALASILMVDKFGIPNPKFGPNSIFSSKTAWIAYHVWSIIVSVATILSWHYQKRQLFMICLLLLIVLSFYPAWTGRG